MGGYILKVFLLKSQIIKVWRTLLSSASMYCVPKNVFGKKKIFIPTKKTKAFIRLLNLFSTRASLLVSLPAATLIPFAFLTLLHPTSSFLFDSLICPNIIRPLSAIHIDN